MAKEILIEVHKRERLVAIIENGRVEDFHIEADRYQSLLGNIYKGRVESILPSINAAFVNIGQERNGFLYLTDAANPLIDEEFEEEPKGFLKRLFKKDGRALTSRDAKDPEENEDKKASVVQENAKESKDSKEVKITSESKAKDEAKNIKDSKDVKAKDAKDTKEVKAVKESKSGGNNRRNSGRRNPKDSRRRQQNSRKTKDDIPLKVGQEILVQVVKDPFGEKGARLTTHISLPGRFVVYMPFDKQTGVSKKIDSVEERKRLREVIKEFSFVKRGGFIIRTVAVKKGKREILRDAKFLHNIWLKIYKKAESQKAPALIYEEGELTWKIVRDYLTDRIDKLLIDDEEECEKIKKFVHTLIGKSMVDKIHLYKGKTSLFDHKNVSKELEKIYDTNVYVRTGAYIVIEPTEGLVVVDVNSGKFKTKASPGEAAFMVNMEVVPEIARQLRLRDLGGIIVIDFIDMTREDHKRKVIDALQRELARDHAKTEVNRITSLGLVEMTRARTGKTIESISFGKCPFCEGRGRVRIS